jgi:hypothetical protein
MIFSGKSLRWEFGCAAEEFVISAKRQLIGFAERPYHSLPAFASLPEPYKEPSSSAKMGVCAPTLELLEGVSVARKSFPLGHHLHAIEEAGCKVPIGL